MTDDANAPTIPETVVRTGTGSLVKPPDRYVMRTMLGRGGMGEVWVARDVRIDRDIAIKLMRRDRSQGDDAVARFLREARVQGRLEHPSIVPVHDLGEQDAPYFAMKRLAGTTLADVLASRDDARWPRRTLLARLVDVCLAVEFAHERGVIHRDLKPANIMLGEYGETYVLDWGLARITGGADSDEGIRTSDLASGESAAGQTVAGEMLGTPGYMSPEQMRGDPVDRRTDVYALGCILYEILVGRPAVPRDQTLEVTLTAVDHRPTRADADVPPELDDLCARATAGDVAARVPTARGLADAIQQFLDGDRDVERRHELAAQHAARAAAVAGDDSTARSEAMREAGRAIALDPGNQLAKDTLARLLLTPPREMPAAVRAKIDEERGATSARVYRGGAFAYLGFLVFIPVFGYLGIHGRAALGLIAAEVSLLAATCAVGVKRPASLPLSYTLLALHAALLLTMGLLLGPLLLLPILIFGTLPIGLMHPVLRRPKLILALHLGAFAVPLGLELAGVMPSSFDASGSALVLHPAGVAVTPLAVAVVIVFTVLVQAVANTAILDSQRADQDRAQEQLHVQAWQLAQLVPEK